MKPQPVVHFEMPATDLKRMKTFYAKAFGWGMQDMGEEMGNYVIAMTAEGDQTGRPKETGMINGGFYPKTPDAPHPSIVISVDDVDKHVKIVEKAGGKILGKPMDIPGVGRYVSFIDTEGNRVSMLQPLPM